MSTYHFYLRPINCPCTQRKQKRKKKKKKDKNKIVFFKQSNLGMNI